jgi:hypothetical protein
MKPLARCSLSMLAMTIALGGLAGCSDSPPTAPKEDAHSPDGNPPIGDPGDGGLDTKAEDATPDAPRPDAPPPDALRPDAPPPDGPPPDAPTSDGDAPTCQVEPVWASTSTGFTFSARGGLPLPTPPDAACRTNDMTFVYAAHPKTLTQTGCLESGRVDRVIELSDAGVSRIASSLGALRTTCGTSCVVDHQNTTLTVQSGSAASRSFRENIVCAGEPVPPAPHIELNALTAFDALLRNISAEACDHPEAGTSDGGTCRSTEPPDAATDAPRDGDAATCTVTPVWNAFSSTFSMTVTGGLPPPPVADAACRGTQFTLEFSNQKATLSQVGCRYNESVAHLINLAPTQVTEIESMLGTIHSTCTKSCGADAPNVALTIGSCALGTQGTYNTNFYAGCAGAMVQPPYISYDDLFRLESFLEGVLGRTCSAPGGVSDAGVCTALPDGGTSGCNLR